MRLATRRPSRFRRAWRGSSSIVVCHSDPERYALLYQLVWRVLNGERDLLEVASDPLVHRLDLMARSSGATCTRCTPSCASAGCTPTASSASPPGSSRSISSWRRRRRSSSTGSARWTGRSSRPSAPMRWDRESLTFGPPARREDAPDRGQLRGGLARLLRERVQPGAGEPDRHARRDAEEILEATCPRPRRFPA